MKFHLLRATAFALFQAVAARSDPEAAAAENAAAATRVDAASPPVRLRVDPAHRSGNLRRRRRLEMAFSDSDSASGSVSYSYSYSTSTPPPPEEAVTTPAPGSHGGRTCRKKGGCQRDKYPRPRRESRDVGPTEPPVPVPDYCKEHPDFGCYSRGWPQCCLNRELLASCPDERPPCVGGLEAVE